ncbi:MAG: helicase HerA-like domain-containing protein, partial [Cytophagales bacterium]
TVTVHLAPPGSLMGPLSEVEYKNLLESSDMYKKYKDTVDPESAFEILSEKVKASQQKQEEEEQEEQRAKEEAVETKSGRTGKSTLEKVLTSPITNQIGKSLVRGVFGVLFGTPPRQTRRRGW